MNVKNKYLIVISVLMIMIICISSVLAYLTASDLNNNTFAIGACNSEIIEKFNPPEKLEPGSAFTKDVRVRNNGPSDCYVRVKAVFTDCDMEKICTVNWNFEDFEYNTTDGYYYYKSKLAEGEATESLFTTVTISDSIAPDEIKDFDILVYSEAIGCAYGEEYEQAWSIE